MNYLKRIGVTALAVVAVIVSVWAARLRVQQVDCLRLAQAGHDIRQIPKCMEK